MKNVCRILVFLFFSLAAHVPAAARVQVVVSIHPLLDIVAQVGGERVNADFIVPAGASPHTFEPRPSDMKKISASRLFVTVGAGLEFWADKAVRSAGQKDLRVLRLSDGMPLRYGTHRHDHAEGGAHGHEESADPHIWLDPVLVKEMAGRIAAVLGETDPQNRAYYKERAARFGKELDALNAEIKARVSRFRVRDYVTFHAAWYYFSERYGLRVAAVIEEAPGKEASPGHIARVVDEVKRSGAKVVFAEPQFNPRVAEVIAGEAGARVLFLDPMGGPGLKGRDTYLGLMRYNLAVMAEAMQ